jgi:hypothetical protein
MHDAHSAEVFSGNSRVIAGGWFFSEDWFGGASRDRSDTCPTRFHFSFAYSALASFRTGMSGSASFQSVRKSL